MKQTLTLALAFEEIANNMQGTNLTKEAFGSSCEAFGYVTKKLDINNEQALILSVMLLHIGNKLESQEFAEFVNVAPLRIIHMQHEFDYLVKKGMIINARKNSNDSWQRAYMLSPGFLHAVKNNKKYSTAIYKHMTPSEVVDIMASLLHACDYGHILYHQMVSLLEKIIDATEHVSLCKKIKELELYHLDLVMFIIGVVNFVRNDQEYIYENSYDDIYPDLYKKNMKSKLKYKIGTLFTHNILEKVDGDNNAYRFSEMTQTMYFSEFDERLDYLVLPDYDKVDENNKLRIKQIANKSLFYNKREEEQLNRLKKLLEIDVFDEVTERMRSHGMSTGFTCLFYGSPGTGKTETALQIARATGREIVQVNMSNLRNMYVGETEKNVQRLFDDYKEKMENLDVTPILLFNEADGIFGNRYTGVNDSADQLENTIQNIILQNMETFEGILIATTNLTDNFDKAFERRFIFKIYFEKPKAEVRKQIWLSLLPKLTPDDAAILATRYDFTGSMIENVAKRQAIDEVLYDQPMTLDTIKRLCEEEMMKKPMGAKKQSA